MATYTKKQAKKLPKSKREGYICQFHNRNPDQQAVMVSCPDCVYISDPCGCGFDEICEECHPWTFTVLT